MNDFLTTLLKLNPTLTLPTTIYLPSVYMDTLFPDRRFYNGHSRFEFVSYYGIVSILETKNHKIKLKYKR